MANTTTSVLPRSPEPFAAGLTNGTSWSLGADRVITWALADSAGDFSWPAPPLAIAIADRGFTQFAEVANLHFAFQGSFPDPNFTTANRVIAGTVLADLIGLQDTLGLGFFPNETIADNLIADLFGTSSVYPNAAGDVWFNSGAE